MIENQTVHPSSDQLSAFGLGKLPSAELNRIGEHISTCAQCRQAVESLPPDSFIGTLKTGSSRGSTVLPVSVSSNTALPNVKPVPGKVLDNLPPELAESAKYDILGKLGQGGMGTVYKGRRRLLGDMVAIKVMNASVANHPEALSRFLREIQAMGQLRDERIVRALDADKIGNLIVLVMEYIEGTSLDRLVQKSGALPVAFVNYCGVQAAEGLQHAHEKGIFHRDIKPANLMVTKDKQIKILDFGLAQIPREQKRKDQTQLNTCMGTADYIPPEQATEAAKADHRADVYSLGCTLYFLLAGRPPFKEDTDINTIIAHIQKDPQPLPELRKEVSPQLWAVINKMMAKKPEDRYQSMLEVSRALTASNSPNAGVKAASIPTLPTPAKETKPESSPFESLQETVVVKPTTPSRTRGKQITKKEQDRTAAKKKSAPAWIIALIVAGVVGLVGFAALIVVTLSTPNGKLVVEIDQADAEVFIDGKKISIKVPGEMTPIEITGSDEKKHKLLVKKDGFMAYTDQFSYQRGKTKPIRVRLKRTAPPVADNSNSNLSPPKPGEERSVEIAPGVKMVMCWIPAGKATLGSPLTEKKRHEHEVEHEYETKGFWLAKHECTQEQYEAVIKNNPSEFNGTKDNKAKGMDTRQFPVESVSWEDCQEFVRQVNGRVGAGNPLGKGIYCLPHEDEWEYAYRGGKGNKRPFYWSDVLNGMEANCNGGFPYGTETKGAYQGRITKVGSYEKEAPHPWGLCDMAGNVWEWCENQYYHEHPHKLLRGGGWFNEAFYSRGGYRLRHVPSYRKNDCGFRLCFRVTVHVAAAEVPNRIAKPGEERSVEIAPGVKMIMCWIPAGKAMLGSPVTETGRSNEETEHEYETNGFWLAKYQCTQEQYEAVIRENPSEFDGKKDNKAKGMDTRQFPVETVSWHDCQEFAKKVNEREGVGKLLGKGTFCLPNEDEWEYANRGGKGNKRAFYWGDVLNGKEANCDGRSPYGIETKGEYLGRTTKVGSYEKEMPHPWGLCDMAGNVWEWCDSWHTDRQLHRVLRGGTWIDPGQNCRAAMRGRNVPDYRHFYFGFRLCFRVANQKPDASVIDKNASNLTTPKQGEERSVEIAPGVKMVMCWIPEGEAQLGSPKAERDAVMKLIKADKEPEWLVLEPEEKRGKFKTKGFWLAKYECTQEQYEAVIGRNPSRNDNKAKGLDTKLFPVEQVSWYDCQEFVKKVNEFEGAGISLGIGKFCLPQEDEWEYAYRGGKGNKRPFYWGDVLNGKEANCDATKPYGVETKGANLQTTTKVGIYEKEVRHPWGLCDMSGNVLEWCDNLFVVDQKSRVLRGGCWAYGVLDCRGAHRWRFEPELRYSRCGFRLCFRLDTIPLRYKNSLGMEFAPVPKGRSWLGGGGGKPGVREVEFKQDFYLGVYEVTQGDWMKIMGRNPSQFRAIPGLTKEEHNQLPVESVSWDDAQIFMKTLNEKAKESGWLYRLPKADEWEYACRGGPVVDQRQCGFDFYFAKPSNQWLPEQANFGHHKKGPCKVGSYPPNSLGLYDMQGNVGEWCEDCKIPANEARQIQGGCFGFGPHEGRAARRYDGKRTGRYRDVGLRIARVPESITTRRIEHPAKEPPSNVRESSAQWKEVEGAYQHVSTGKPDAMLFGSDEWTDYTLSFKAKISDGKKGLSTFLRSETNGNTWWLKLGQNHKYASFWRIGSTTYTMGGAENHAVDGSLESNRWYQFEVQVKANTLKLAIDKVVIFHLKISLDTRSHSHTRGFVGLDSESAQSWWKDIRVISSSGTTLWSGPQVRALGSSPNSKSAKDVIVGVWEHKAGNGPPKPLVFFPNGKVSGIQGGWTPDSPHTWTFNGSILKITWVRAQKQAKPWIDVCVVSADRKSYRGKNQDNVAIVGRKMRDSTDQ